MQQVSPSAEAREPTYCNEDTVKPKFKKKEVRNANDGHQGGRCIASSPVESLGGAG